MRQWKNIGEQQLKFAAESMYIGLLLMDIQQESVNASLSTVERKLDKEIAKLKVGMSTGIEIDAIRLEKQDVQNNLESIESSRG